MTDIDKAHLRRCIELAAEAVERGDDPFGSLLVGADGEVLAERSNEVCTTGDVTAHPELALASWASRHLSAEVRAQATMYTSGEHCAMCAAAHVWAGIGRLVFVLSGEMIRQFGSAEAVSIDLSAREVVARSNVDVQVDGPCEELVEAAGGLFGEG
ncbi:nucleoside deaminase [Persicimonas caeni]|uniref:Nucleoside deaminase n=2 Tax=Persicimonas caeni TaxID=2292766 RepID=A0A4Y6Q2X6_PERCE|nr:nucleoside deaminase [Persicimonas caeni]QED36127.1 nucleoside deaminase [Persicimonas caeni]